MKTLILTTNTNAYQVINNQDGTINILNGSGNQIGNIGLFIKQLGGVENIINTCREYNGSYAEYLVELKQARQKKIALAEQTKKDIIAGVSEFWQDVHRRIGMDVCTPFMHKFPGHSFVAYDTGFVWSKTMKTVFKLYYCTANFHHYPKAYKKVISFGSNEIEQIVNPKS